MKPEIKISKMSSLLVTMLLILILVSMLAGYIYYGMYYAKNAANVAVVEEVPAPTESDAMTARRAQIIAALNMKAASVMSAEEQAAVTASLGTKSAPVESEEAKSKRAAIVEALQKQ